MEIYERTAANSVTIVWAFAALRNATRTLNHPRESDGNSQNKNEHEPVGNYKRKPPHNK